MSGAGGTAVRNPGLVALIAATACWGSVVVTVKVAARGLSPVGITLIELGTSALTLTVVLLVRRRRLPRPTLGLIGAAALEPGLAYLLINAGIAGTSGSHAALIIGLESVVVVLLSAAVTRSRPPVPVLLGLAAAVAGAAVLAGSPTGNASVEGDALVLAGVLAAAGYVLVAQRLVRQFDALTLTGYQFIVGTLVSAPVLALLAVTGEEGLGRPDLASVLAAAVSGLVGSTAAFLLYNWALGSVPAALAGTSLTLIPVFGVAFAAIALGEPVTSRTIVAGLAVLAGVAITQQSSTAPSPAPPAEHVGDERAAPSGRRSTGRSDGQNHARR